MDAGLLVRHPFCLASWLWRRRRGCALRRRLRFRQRRRRRSGRRLRGGRRCRGGRRRRRWDDGRLRRWRSLRHLRSPRQLLAIEISRHLTFAALSSRVHSRPCRSRLARIRRFAGIGRRGGGLARVGLRRCFSGVRLSSGFARISLRRGFRIHWRRCLCICLRSLIRIGLRRRGNAQAAKRDRSGQCSRCDRYVPFHGHESLHWTVSYGAGGHPWA